MSRSLRFPPALLAALLLTPALLLGGCELFNNTGDGEAAGPPRRLELPVPGGPFAVGTTTLHLVDASREETYTPQAGDGRELMVQLWYPTDALPAPTPAPYMDPLVVDLFAAVQDYTTPDSMRTLMGRLRTNGIPDAPLSATAPALPVVFVSHGLTGVRALGTTFIEELASRGYLVVGIDHTFGSFATVFPGGRVVVFSTNQPPFERVVDLWADDLRFVLTELGRLHANDPSGRFTGRLDLARVGAMGHSTGGSAAAQVMVKDPRFKAGISLDAPQAGEAVTEGFDEPFMFVFANPSEYFSRQIQSRLRNRGYNVVIDGTTHFSFTDLPVLLDLGGVSAARAAASGRPPGTLAAARNLEILNAFIGAFFEKHLRGQAAPLLDGNTGAFPEVTFEAFGGIPSVAVF